MNKGPKEHFIDCLPIFSALGDETRQKILFLISEEKPINVLQIAELISLSRPAVSHHLGILQSAGIIGCNKVGRDNYYYFSFDSALEKMTNLIASVNYSRSVSVRSGGYKSLTNSK